MATLIGKAKAQCPNSKIIASGYSQGAMVAHDSLSKRGINAATTVAGAVFFGDPFLKQQDTGLPTDNVKEFCNKGDSICEVCSLWMQIATQL